MAMMGSFEFEEAEEFRGRELVVGGIIAQKPANGIPLCVRRVWGMAVCGNGIGGHLGTGVCTPFWFIFQGLLRIQNH